MYLLLILGRTLIYICILNLFVCIILQNYIPSICYDNIVIPQYSKGIGSDLVPGGHRHTPRPSHPTHPGVQAQAFLPAWS